MRCLFPFPLSSRNAETDIFSDSFQSILNQITPSILSQFDSSTVLLLLEVCNSYLYNENASIQYLWEEVDTENNRNQHSRRNRVLRVVNGES